jgi:ATP-dependent Clp protease protease subunit
MNSSESDSESGLIWVSQFNEESAKQFTESVLKIAHSDHTAPITIYIDSYGGDVYSLRTMLSVMDSVVNPIITVCTGKAMSAAAVLLSHGDIRCVGKHGSVMIHEVSSQLSGHVEDITHENVELQLINKHFTEVLAKNCKKTVKQLKKLWRDKRDVYFTATEAVKFGIADKIGVPTIAKSLNYELKFLVHPE